MSDAQQPGSHATEEQVEVEVRRAPKVGVFVVLGGIIGLITATVLTFAFGTPGAETSATGFVYSKPQVFGFIALWTVPLGAGIFGLFAAWLDRRSRKRAKLVRAERDHITEA